MSNFLLNPNNFKDQFLSTPPGVFSGGDLLFSNDGSELNDNFITSAGVADPVPGDIVSFSVVGTVAGSRIRVTINGTIVFTQVLVPDQTYVFVSDPLLATHEVMIQVDGTSGGQYEYDVTVIPTPAVVSTVDTYSMKGFFAFGSLASNVDGVVSTLGELSVRSETFAKDRLLFGTNVGTEPNGSSATLSVFSTKKADGTTYTPPVAYAEKLMEFGKWVYDQAIGAQFTNDPEIFRQQFLAEFTGYVVNITVGEMRHIGSTYLPENVVFYLNPNAFVGEFTGPELIILEKSRIKIWFSDHAFATQYDEFEIDIVPPIMPLDHFFYLADLVQTEVGVRTIPELMAQVQVLAGNNPYTLLKSINFDYHDPTDLAFTFPTTWTFLIYGAGGDNIDAIKEALVTWILANSTHTREEWAVIFPDIFTSTEFIITPMWNQYAVPNMTLQQGIYSPTVMVAETEAISQATCVGTSYTPEHIAANLAVVGSTYKSIALLACGGPENRDDIIRFDRQWPDYIAVPTSSIDFNRMQPNTQQWVMLLYQLLLVAEEMTEFSDIPLGLTRLRRVNGDGDTVLYVVASFENVQYLVVAKSWFLNKFEPEDPDPVPLTLLPNVGTLTPPPDSGELSVTFSATGGTGPYTFAASSVYLTAGGVDPDTGVFVGTISGGEGVSGNFELHVEVTDANGTTTSRDYVVEVQYG